MKNPKDFPKGEYDIILLCKEIHQQVLPALWAVTIAEMVVFTLCGALMYHWVGK